MADFESLAQELNNPLPDARQRAVVGLVETGDLRALPLLVEAARKDPNTKVRFFAKRGILLLRQRGSGTAATGRASMASATMRQVPDPRQVLTRWPTLPVEDRIRTIQRLSAYGDVRLLPYYTTLLKHEQEPFVRSKLCVAIGILGDPAGLPVLKETLADRDLRVRSNVVEAIGFIGGEPALPLLFAALAGPENPRLVRNVQRFLERGNEAAFEEYLRKAFSTGRTVVRQTVVRAVELLAREQLYDVLALAVVEDPEGTGRPARALLESLAAGGLRRARLLLDRCDGKAPEPGAEAADAAGAAGRELQLEGATEEERFERVARVISAGDRSDLAHLVAWLPAEQTPRVRSLLVRGIASLGGNRAVKTMLSLLEDADARVRADAIECLYPFATDPDVARLVPPKLEDASGRVRANALVLLGRIPGFDIQKPLGALAASERPEDRLRAAYVVLDVERDDATLLIAPLLADENDRVRRRASEVLHVLAERGNDTAMRLLAGSAPPVEPTLAYEPDEDVSVIIPAAQLAEVLRAPAAVSRAVPAPDPVSDVSIEHDRLVYMLDSGDERERLKAIRILEEIGDQSVVEPIRRLMNDRSEEVRQHAARAFCSLKERLGTDGPSAIPEASEDDLEKLRMRLCHREPKTRQAALSELGPAHRELREFLLERVGTEPDPHVKASMVLAAGMLAGPKDVASLSQWLGDDDARVRANAIEALEYAGDVSVVKLIAPCLGDSASRVRLNSAVALKHFERSKVLEILGGMLKSKQAWQRFGAIAALVELGGTEVLALLYSALESEETIHLFALALRGIIQIPDAGRRERLEQIAAGLADPKKKDWIDKGLVSLQGGEEFPSGAPGMEGFLNRIRPTADDVAGAVETARPEASAADEEKSLERQKLARMVAHLRDDLYSKDSKIRQEAAVRLGRVEHPAAVRALTVALSHSDSVVKYLARRSLKALLEKPAAFDATGDMTHSAVKSAVAKAEKEELNRGPVVGDFNWTLLWAGVLMVMLLLYALFGGSVTEVEPRKPKRAKRPVRPAAVQAGEPAGQVRLGGGDSSQGSPRRPSTREGVPYDERPGEENLPAAGTLDPRGPAPASEDGPKPPSSGRGEGVQPEDYPQDPPKRIETPPDASAIPSRTIEPEAGVTDRHDFRE
jgi:HEAT repeat protein